MFILDSVSYVFSMTNAIKESNGYYRNINDKLTKGSIYYFLCDLTRIRTFTYDKDGSICFVEVGNGFVVEKEKQIDTFRLWQEPTNNLEESCYEFNQMYQTESIIGYVLDGVIHTVRHNF